MEQQHLFDGMAKRKRKPRRESATPAAAPATPGSAVFLSYSGGVESTACLLLFPDAVPIFADTGWEHRRMYEWLDHVESVTGRQIVRIRREDCTLPEYIERQSYAPSPVSRFCTRMFKIEPIDAFLAGRVPCELLIGLNADEADMRTGNHGLAEGVTYRYPLVEAGKTRADCLAVLDSRGLRPRFPRYMKRGGCKGCFFKSRAEYRAMAVMEPGEADEVAELEESIQDIRGARYGIRDGIRSLARFNAEVRAQKTWEHDGTNDAEGALPTPCGVFCHR